MACTSPATENNLADGSYLFKVKGTDAAGNTSAAESYPFMVAAGGAARSAWDDSYCRARMAS